MEAMMAEFLDEAGALLAEAVRGSLRAHGLPEFVEIVRQGDRVIVASRSALVRQAELGAPGRPARAALEGAARTVEASVVGHITHKLGNFSA